MCMAHPLLAQEPARLALEKSVPLPGQPSAADQHLAATVARQLKQSGSLHSYRIDLACRAGVVEVSGEVANPSQHSAALRLIQSVPGVQRVVDRLTVREESGLVLAQADQLPEAGAVAPNTKQDAGAAGPAVDQKPSTDPMPMMSAPGMLGSGSTTQADLNPPKMPPFAWPTYSPYPNFSRVAYPTAYPYNAWPYIGPIYPFPKVPLGWRSVKLEFDEGYWWFSRVACKHDWWRLRVW
jgi:hypothetical protein